MEPTNEFRPSQFVAPAEAGDNEIFRRHRLIIHDWMGPSKVRHCNSLGFRSFATLAAPVDDRFHQIAKLLRRVFISLEASCDPTLPVDHHGM